MKTNTQNCHRLYELKIIKNLNHSDDKCHHRSQEIQRQEIVNCDCR